MLKIVKVANKLARKYAQTTPVSTAPNDIVEISGPKVAAIQQIATVLNTLVASNANNSQLKEFKALFDAALKTNQLNISAVTAYYKLLQSVPGIHEAYGPLAYIYKHAPTKGGTQVA